jgi:hypothetical protein
MYMCTTTSSRFGDFTLAVRGFDCFTDHMLELSDDVLTRRARLAARLTAVIESDWRVDRCTRIDFVDEGGALLVVELIRLSDPMSRNVIARELEFAVTQALPPLPWVRVQIV